MVKKLVKCLVIIFFIQHLSYAKIGDEIVYYAKKFIGVPYDPDPIGAYVREKKIVYDSEVDCMYLTFRVVELALAGGDENKALDFALDKRFKTHGILSNGKVLNYDDRFEYGEDMVLSGKWGKVINFDKNVIRYVYSSRLDTKIGYIPKKFYERIKGFIMNGDIIFLVKDPSRSIKGEIVGHLGILEVAQDVYIIHAKGSKNKGGAVVKEKLRDYLSKTKYIGFIITRFE